MPLNRFDHSILALIYILAIPVCVADEDLWQQLAQNGRSLDIMGMESMGDHVMLVGAKYVEEVWQSQEDSAIASEPTSIVRKQLVIMRLDNRQRVQWEQSYPSLPDAQEVFSISQSGSQRLCVVFGEQQGSEQALNPVLLQVNANGKIVWASHDLLARQANTTSPPTELEQIANLDTLRVVGSPDEGCLLTYITRHLTAENETFRLNLVFFDSGGSEKWRRTITTQLYGKMFALYDQQARQYVVVQTNQSRDAAMLAMMLGVPFRPQTDVIGVDRQGHVVYQHEKVPSLDKIWVKDIADGKDQSLMLAGKSTAAWAAIINNEGKLSHEFDQLDGEFDTVAANRSGGFALVRGEYLTVLDDGLKQKSNQKIAALTTKQYINRYLSARLPEDLPAQQILSLPDDEFLVLYKLGSKLYKLSLGNKK